MSEVKLTPPQKRAKHWFGRKSLSTAQKKSIKLSKFQAIGWFFNAVDIMVEGSILDQINGMFCFDRESISSPLDVLHRYTSYVLRIGMKGCLWPGV